jgi:hypothetical protein
MEIIDYIDILTPTGRYRINFIPPYLGSLRYRRPLSKNRTEEVVSPSPNPPNSEMKRDVLSAGLYTLECFEKDYLKIQILTIEQLLNGEQVQLPSVQATFKKAEKVEKVEGIQLELNI